MTKPISDERILELLRENARAPTAQLGRKLGLSRSTVHSRIEGLKKRGVIGGFTVRLGEAHARGEIMAQVMITASPKLGARVATELRRLPAVRRLYAVSGVYDLLATVVATSVGEMDALLDKVRALEGVERTLSSIILSTKIDR